mgnify:CR=1 FL=1
MLRGARTAVLGRCVAARCSLENRFSGPPLPLALSAICASRQFVHHTASDTLGSPRSSESFCQTMKRPRVPNDWVAGRSRLTQMQHSISSQGEHAIRTSLHRGTDPRRRSFEPCWVCQIGTGHWLGLRRRSPLRTMSIKAGAARSDAAGKRSRIRYRGAGLAAEFGIYSRLGLPRDFRADCILLPSSRQEATERAALETPHSSRHIAPNYLVDIAFRLTSPSGTVPTLTTGIRPEPNTPACKLSKTTIRLVVSAPEPLLSDTCW